jgi:hypothetical protein
VVKQGDKAPRLNCSIDTNRGGNYRIILNQVKFRSRVMFTMGCSWQHNITFNADYRHTASMHLGCDPRKNSGLSYPLRHGTNSETMIR